MFQEQYLTPQAQITSLAAGYEAVGLNKMGLAGFSAGASSASAPQASAPTPSGNGSVSPSASGLMDALNLGLQERQLSLSDRQVSVSEGKLEVDKTTAATNQYRAETERILAEADIALKKSQTTGQDISNSWLNQVYSSKVSNTEADTALKQQNQAYLAVMITSEGVRQSLMKHQIRLVDAQAAAAQYDAAVKAAQAKYADRFYSAAADLEAAQAELAGVDAAAASSVPLQLRVESLKGEMNYMITKAAMENDIYNGDAFKAQVSGKMTSAEKWQTGLNFGASIIGAGVSAATGLGGASIAAKGMKAAAEARLSPVTPAEVKRRGYQYR